MQETQRQSQGEVREKSELDWQAQTRTRAHQGPPLSRRRSAFWSVAALASLVFASAPEAQALITPAATVDGPSSSILEFGGVAMASDGSGGVTYVKAVGGVPHAFASRLVEGEWSAPVRVDGDQPFAASQPRIAAGPKGELLVVWVSPLATAHGKLRDGLFSASFGPRANGFGRSQLIDSNVGEGIGVDPSLASTAPGQAIVAYRVITFDFSPGVFTTAVQLRSGDVMADVRLARLKDDRWSRMGAVNRSPEASMRPPGPFNGPQVAAASDGAAAVAWQEPDQSGAARILLRRVFGTTPGPVLEASPTSWEGQPVTADADAFSLAVSAFAQVRLAMRIAPGSSSALSGRLLLNSLEPNFSLTAGTLTGAQLVDGGAVAGGAGPPGVAASDEGGGEGSMRLGFLAGSQLRLMGVDNEGALGALATPAGPTPQPGSPVVTAVNPEGGGLAAYEASDAEGHPAVAVRQEYPSGAAQTGLLFARQGGPVADLAIGRSDSGDGLIGFLQGELGRAQIVVERATAPPASFKVTTPARWVRPPEAKLHWDGSAGGGGPVRYSVLIGGRVVRSGLRRHVFLPRPAQLGSGVKSVRVLATDQLGQQMLSRPAKLWVDGEPPVVSLRVQTGRGRVTVRVADPDSGLNAKRSRVSFGDGTAPAKPRRSRGGAKTISRPARGGRKGKGSPAYSLGHTFEHGGRYRVVVRARDRAGNRIARSFEVKVR
jgi:hypothetical protein